MAERKHITYLQALNVTKFVQAAKYIQTQKREMNLGLTCVLAWYALGQ